MMQNIKSIAINTLLFSILISLCSSQQCLSDSGQSQVDLIQTGTFNLINQFYQKQTSIIQQSCYDIPLTYNVPAGKSYSVILSTLQISSQQNYVVDFSLRSFKKQRSFTIILVSTLNDWKSHTISYLVDSRDDMFLGNFILNSYQFTACGNNQSQIQSRYTIPNWNRPFSNNQTVIIELFISGIRNIYTKNSSFLLLGVGPVSLNINTGQISYTIQNINLNNLLNIQFNYLIISQNNFKYDSQQISLKGSGITNRQNFKNNPLYTVGGLTYFSSQKANANSFTILSFYQNLISCKGSKCKAACVSKKLCLSNQGKITNNTRGNQQCLLQCGQNEVFNSANQCVCIYGFSKINNLCQKSIPRINCSSSQVFNFTTNRCQCRDDFIQFSPGACLVRCNVNGFMNNSRCDCMVGFRLYSANNVNFCHNCEQLVDEKNLRCLCYEPQFYMAANGRCIQNTCKSNYRFFPSQNRCGCLSTQIDVNGTCYTTCGINQYNLNGCVCLPGFTLVKQRNGCFRRANCTKPNEIPDQSGYDCICRDGFQRDNQTQTCVIKCPLNEVLSINKNTCDCQRGFIRDSQTGRCKQNCGVNQTYDRNVQSCRCKDNYIRDTSMSCILLNSANKNCNLNQVYSDSLQSCVCMNGYTRNVQGICQIIQTKTCPSNSILKNNQCICNPGFIKMGQSCINSCGINQSFNQQLSSCQCNQGFGKINNVCRACPTNSTTRNNSCFCLMGLRWNQDANTCQLICQTNSVRTQIALANSQSVFICQCISGFIMNSQGRCDKIPDPVCPPSIPSIPQNSITCPGTSVWDSANFRCFCNSTSLFLIGGVCKPCESNQGWNGSSCVCLTGFNLINSKCLKCDVNSVFRGGKCNCNFGYYDQNPANIQNTLCKSCHQTCGTCTGPLDTQCITCLNPEATLTRGKCIQDTNCPKGFFNSSSGCKQCSQYCNKCTNQNLCLKCVSGFQIQKIDILGKTAAFCPEICGDGKRFEYQCDDGNLKDGDGCDSSCNIQSGWSCSAGSPKQASVCIKGAVQKAILSVTKPLRMIGKISQGATLSYLPDNLSKNMCVKCDDILMVKLVSYTILPSVDVSYIPTTRFKYSITFTFNGIFAIPDFVFSVQINPKYEKFFTAQDMSQRLVIPVVPADLALNNEQDTLDLGDLGI